MFSRTRRHSTTRRGRPHQYLIESQILETQIRVPLELSRVNTAYFPSQSVCSIRESRRPSGPLKGQFETIWRQATIFCHSKMMMMSDCRLIHSQKLSELIATFLRFDCLPNMSSEHYVTIVWQLFQITSQRREALAFEWPSHSSTHISISFPHEPITELEKSDEITIFGVNTLVVFVWIHFTRG